MSATWASVSTFWTRVGRPPTPRSRMERSPAERGYGGAPAVQRGRRRRSLGPPGTCPAHASPRASARRDAGRARSSMAVVTTGMTARGRSSTCPACPQCVRREGQPVEHQVGRVGRSKASFRLAGSLSAPLATTTGRRRVRSPPRATWWPPGTRPPRRPARPLASTSSSSVGAADAGDDPSGPRGARTWDRRRPRVRCHGATVPRSGVGAETIVS